MATVKTKLTNLGAIPLELWGFGQNRRDTKQTGKLDRDG